MIDRSGKTYTENGTMYVLPEEPPYAAFLQFAPPFSSVFGPVDPALVTDSVSAFAAPYNVEGSPCCAESSAANRVPSIAVANDSGGLMIELPDPVPSGSQVSIFVPFGPLFGSAAQTELSPDDLAAATKLSFFFRFYVGAVPGGTKEPDAGTKPNDAGGGSCDATAAETAACLLSYNDALVPSGGDACCYRQGGKNTCDTSIACNDASGPECCLIYSSQSTAEGEGCCLYAGNANDVPSGCQALLKQSR